MDRRTPNIGSHAVAASIFLAASLSFATAAQTLELESKSLSLQNTGDAAVTNFGWLPVIVCLVALAVAGFFFLRRAARAQSRPQGSIQVIDRRVMSRGRSLSLIRVGDRVVLIGESAQGFQRLAEFNANDDAAASRAVQRLAS